MNYRKNLRLDYLKLGLMPHQVLVNHNSLLQTLLKNKDLGVGVGLQLRDQSIRDAFMVLKSLLILINMEMRTSCSIHKARPAQDATKMTQPREALHQSKEEMRVFYSVVFQFLPPEARTLFININNLTSNIKTNNKTRE